MRRALFAVLAMSLGIGFVGTTLLPAASDAAAATTAAAASNACAGDNLSPTSRTLAPTSVYGTSGTVSNPGNVLSGQSTRLTGNGSAVILDFGKEVGGIVTLGFAGSSGSGQSVGLAFSESSQSVGTNSDQSAGGNDGAVFASVSGSGSYTMPADKLRGGFRYLTLFLNSGGWVDLNKVSLAFDAAPGNANPSAYPDYFCSNDDLLNRIWYAGAYTVQLDTIDPTQGRVYPPVSSGWENNAVVGVGSEALVDGAKRDRTVWPGDLGVSVPTDYVSTDDMTAVRNSLTTMYNAQKSTGELPWGGPEFNLYSSDTYHLWTLIGTSTYYLYTGDKSWLDGVWSKYQLGMNFITAKIDGNGLLNVTGTLDWARGDQGGENIEANVLLYQALNTGATLAQAEGNSGLATTYRSTAASVQQKINALLWDSSVGAYKDNPSSGLHPQDGNSLAVWYGVASSSQASSIAAELRTNWNSIGAQTPEWNDNVSPFAGSMEVYAHFVAGDDTNALNLIRTEWGYMLSSSIGTGSTFWEGMTNTGGFANGGSFTSLDHGWSTGPTGALTTEVLGIAPTATAGAAYQVVPHPGDLTHVEGTVTVASGKAVHASYDHGAAGDFSMQVDSSTNSGSTGVIAVPTWGQSRVVTVNGTVAWNGTSFTGASGISSADKDANYVYFRGVQPGTYSLSYPAGGPPPPTVYQTLPGTWAKCAVEGGSCPVSGSSVIAFGASGRFNYAGETGATACTTGTFGDPNPGVAKSCYVQTAPPGTAVWAQCATENATCSFTGLMTVAYGANGSYKYATLGGGTACSNSVFGDPIPGTAKTCSVLDPPPSFTTWTTCAAENGTCAMTGTHEVAYGASGKYFYGTFTGGTPCTNAVFGDPAFGTAKACYVQ